MIRRAGLLLAAAMVMPALAWAAPAFDACSGGAGGTGTLNWTQNIAAGAKGAVVLVGQIGGGTDEVTAATVGGTNMPAIAGSPVCKATGEPGCVHAFFLGASVPTGASTAFQVTVSGSSLKRAGSCTVTAGADTSVDATGTINSDSLDDPSGTIATTAGVETFVMAALFSGESTGGNISGAAAYTEVVEDSPGGGGIVHVQRRTTNPTGGSVTFNWVTSVAEDAVAIGVAVREGVASACAGRLLLTGAGGC